MNKSKQFWDRIAKSYAASAISDPQSYDYTLERTAHHLKPSDSVLEIGCGTGTTALKLAPLVAELTASDISPAMLEIGAQKAGAEGIDTVRFVEAPAEQPPEGSFDAVLAFNLLHLVDDLDQTLSAAHQALKPGGLFISKTICKPGLRSSAKMAAMRLALPVLRLLGKAPPVRFIRADKLEAQIAKAGFDIIERDSFPARDPRLFLVAKRR